MGLYLVLAKIHVSHDDCNTYFNPLLMCVVGPREANNGGRIAVSSDKTNSVRQKVSSVCKWSRTVSSQCKDLVAPWLYNYFYGKKNATKRSQLAVANSCAMDILWRSGLNKRTHQRRRKHVNRCICWVFYNPSDWTPSQICCWLNSLIHTFDKLLWLWPGNGLVCKLRKMKPEWLWVSDRMDVSLVLKPEGMISDEH